MCDPGTAAIVMTVASGAVSAVGSIQQGNAAMADAEYQAAVSRNNAIMERNKAKQELQAGEVEANQKRREVAAIIGRQRAGVGASGVTMSGSVLDVLTDTAGQGAFDIAMIRHNAEIRATDRNFSAQNFDAQSELMMMQGRAARQAGYMSALGTALSTGSSVAGGWQGGAGDKKPLGKKPLGGGANSGKPNPWGRT